MAILALQSGVRLIAILLALCANIAAQRWSVQTSGLDTILRGISVKYGSVNGKRNFIVWASGSNGVILRSTNDGSTWKQLRIPGAADFDFRDIEAFDADTAYVMSSGDGNRSRIYKTTDGGKTWGLQYSDSRPGFFLDSLACDSKSHCVALSDPVDGKFLVLNTDDGEHWIELPRDKMPAPLSGEGAFAASGTAIALCGHDHIYFGTGGGRVARVFHSKDGGRSWTAVETPIAGGNASSGIFSVACGADLLVAVGGDYQEPGSAQGTAAHSYDAGATWHLAARLPGGYRSAVAHFSQGNFVAVGTNGTDIANSEGRKGMRWEHTDSLNLNAASFYGPEGWAVGPKGTIARFKSHFIFRTNPAKSAPARSLPVR